MKNKNIKFIFSLILVCFLLTTCENYFMKPWWEEKEHNYVFLTKSILEFVYETIVEVRPYVEIQNLNIIGVNYVIFSGDQFLFNAGPGVPGGTNLSLSERNANIGNVLAMAKELEAFKEYLLILHGHANPVDYTDEEKKQLYELSFGRASDVEKYVRLFYENLDIDFIVRDNVNLIFDPDLTPPAVPNPELENRIFVRGYGGGNNVGSSTYAGLNRRVEMILVELTTEITGPSVGG